MFYLASRVSGELSVEMAVLLLVELVASPFYYSRVGEGSSEESILELVNLGSGKGVERTLSVLAKADKKALGDKLVCLVDCVSSYYEASVFSVRNDFEIGARLVDAAQGFWGDRWNLYVLAMNFARVLDSLPSTDSDITDHQSSLCMRACSARANRLNSEWWGRQFELVDQGSNLDRVFLIAMVNRWMPAEIAVELSGSIASHLDSISGKEWSRTMIDYGYGGEDSEDDFGINELILSGEISPRLACLLAVKVNLSSRFLIWEHCLKGYVGGEKTILDISVNILIDYAAKNEEFWDLALEKMREAYKIGCLFHLHRIEFASGEREPVFSVSVARKICESISEYPLDVVYYAEQILSIQAGASAVPVGRIAEESDWFFKAGS